jgi:hypothetical protein
MPSQSWKPLVYLSTTVGAVVLVLALTYGITKLLFPGFTILGIHRGEGRALIAIACALAYGSVVVTTRILKRYWGREFGTYLDDPDRETLGPPVTSTTTMCRRCGTPFQVFSNDAHAAGFCSLACKSRGA